jgi:hypothetical protein
MPRVYGDTTAEVQLKIYHVSNDDYEVFKLNRPSWGQQTKTGNICKPRYQVGFVLELGRDHDRRQRTCRKNIVLIPPNSLSLLSTQFTGGLHKLAKFYRLLVSAQYKELAD